MGERNMRMLPELFPQPVYTEIPQADGSVMEQYDPILGQLRILCRIIVMNGLIGVIAVDMKHINGTVGEQIHRPVEIAPHQGADMRKFTGRNGLHRSVDDIVIAS